MLRSLVLALAAVSATVAREGPRAQTENGPVVGTYGESYLGHSFRAFKGIPYAKPPVGKLRFKDPERLSKPWVGEWYAQEFGNQCLQYDEFTKTITENGIKYEVHGDEDCLYINIFHREGGPSKKHVIFMIHGGAFMFGSSQFYGPEYIMDRDDIVYVTFNYRLGPLGFFTTGDEIIPGNSGLKDQVAALQWVHRNIANFGGDPNKITIAGLSAGGASVNYLLLSPLAKGLFHQAFSFSGSALCSWAFVTNGLERSRQLAEGLGCASSDSRTILKCLRRRPAKQIVDEVKSFMVWNYNPFTVFGPVVEVNSSRAFINEHPREIIKRNDDNIPWVIGVTTEDGLYPSAEYITNEELLSSINKDWHKIGPSLLFLDPFPSKRETTASLDTIKKHYFGDESIGTETRGQLVKLLTERNFAAGIVEAAKLRSNTYLYEYGYQGATSTSNFMSNTKEPLGASHCDDFGHIVHFEFTPSHTTDRDKKMAAVMKNIFFTFVKTGSVPEEYSAWKPFSSSGKYLKLKSPDSYSISNDPILDFKSYNELFEPIFTPRDEL